MDDDVTSSHTWYSLGPEHFEEADSERFWSQVEMTDDAEDCWLWKGAMVTDGYGTYRVSRLWQQGAHRVAYVLATGESIKDKDHVCHVPHCAYKRCVNPAHLYLGNAVTNQLDRYAIGNEVSKERRRINKVEYQEYLQRKTDERVAAKLARRRAEFAAREIKRLAKEQRDAEAAAKRRARYEREGNNHG